MFAAIKLFLIIAGCGLMGIALLGLAIIVDMFQHPRGMGAETLVGALFGIFVLTTLCGGVVCFYWARRLSAEKR